MCRVGNCCVYLDLEKGSFAIGITNLVIAVLQLLSNFGGLTILGIVTAALCIVINILLIIGSKQRKTIFVFIWLCVTIVFIVLSLLTLIMSLITLISNEHGMGALGGVIIFALTIGTY